MLRIPRNCIITILLFLCAPAFSQDTTGVDRPNASALTDSVRRYDLELAALQHSLEVATVEWARLQHTSIRSWVIGNPALRDSLFYALMTVDSSIQSEAGADAQILATLQNDLIEVRFGNSVFKGMTLQNAIDESGNRNLYEEVALSYRYSRDIELRDPSFALETDHQLQLLDNDRLIEYYRPLSLFRYPDSVRLRSDLSLSGIQFKVGPLWGGEWKIGNEEIGFPMWTSGKAAYMATYKDIKLGFELPFTGGLGTNEPFPPFVLRGRKLNGTRGIVGEFDFGIFGGKFSFTRLTDGDTSELTDPDLFYYVTIIAQAYFSFGIELTPTNLVRVKAGAGTHRVNSGSIQTGPSMERITVGGPHKDFVSPYLKFEYKNENVAEHFDITVQYYDVTLTTTAMLEVIRNVLSFEIIYMWPLSAELPEWQNPEFLILSPHIYLSF